MRYLEDYLKYLRIEKNLSSRTIEIYQRDIYEFESYIGDKEPMESIKGGHIRGFLCFIAEKNNQPITRRRKLTSLRNFFKYLKQERKIKFNPALGIVMPKISEREPCCLSEKEIKIILNQIKKKKSRFKKRNYLMIKLLAETGVRLNEMTRLDIQNIDTSNLMIRIIRKGGREQEIPINKELNELLEMHIEGRDVEEALFISNYKKRINNRSVGLIFQECVKDVRVEKKISVHSLRHSFCTRLLDKGVNLKIIQVLAGHQSISTTEKYLHIAKSKLRKEVRMARV